jgi:hypothetical protein
VAAPAKATGKPGGGKTVKKAAKKKAVAKA